MRQIEQLVYSVNHYLYSYSSEDSIYFVAVSAYCLIADVSGNQIDYFFDLEPDFFTYHLCIDCYQFSTSERSKM